MVEHMLLGLFGGWLQSGGTLYRLTDERRPRNCDEIKVTLVNGEQDSASLVERARHIAAWLNSNDEDMLVSAFHVTLEQIGRLRHPGWDDPSSFNDSARTAIRASICEELSARSTVPDVKRQPGSGSVQP